MGALRDEKTIPLWESNDGDRTEYRPAPRSKTGGKHEVIFEEVATGKKLSCRFDARVIVGRNEKRCDFQISENDMYMSGVHMKMTADRGRLYVEDLGSTNGTFLNERRVTGMELVREGDILRLGHSEYLVLRIN